LAVKAIKPGLLTALALLLIVGFGRQLAPVLVLVVIAVLVFGGGGKALAKGNRKRKVVKAKTRVQARKAAQAADLADARHALAMQTAYNKARQAEIKKAQLKAARDAGRAAGQAGSQ
jgi:hypothetical protein